MRGAYRPQFYVQVLFVLLFQSISFGWAECYGTPQAAVDGAVAGQSAVSKAGQGGYRVMKVQTDQLLGRRWALVSNCNHPEWSMLTLPISKPRLDVITNSRTATVSSPVVVRAGDPVRLWRREAMLQIEVAGVSEDNGSVGKTVRVRLAQIKNGNASAPEEFIGIVQGPSDVEMKP